MMKQTTKRQCAICMIAILCFLGLRSEVDRREEHRPPLIVGMDISGDRMRAAVVDSDGLFLIPVDEQQARRAQSDFEKSGILSPEVLSLVKAACRTRFGVEPNDVVVALPNRIPFAARAKLYRSFTEAGLRVVRNLERTTAAAFANLQKIPQMENKLCVIERTPGAINATEVDIGDGVCEVVRVVTAEHYACPAEFQEKTLAADGVAVVVGAALEGGVLSGRVKDALLLDVVHYEIGIASGGEPYRVVLDKDGTTIPYKRSFNESIRFPEDGKAAVVLKDADGQLVDVCRLEGGRRMRTGS